MHVGRAKRRCQGVEHRLAQRTRPRSLFIADAKKTVTHAHIELARTRDFQSQFVKCAAAGASVERRLVRTITDEIETFLIFEHAAGFARCSKIRKGSLSSVIVRTSRRSTDAPAAAHFTN